MPATDVTSHSLRNAGMASTLRTRWEVGADSWGAIPAGRDGAGSGAIAPHLLRGRAAHRRIRRQDTAPPSPASVVGGTHEPPLGQRAVTACSQWSPPGYHGLSRIA